MLTSQKILSTDVKRVREDDACFPKKWNIESKDGALYHICNLLSQTKSHMDESWGKFKKTKNTWGLYLNFPEKPILNKLCIHLTIPIQKGFPHWTIQVRDSKLNKVINRKIQIDVDISESQQFWSLQYPRLIFNTKEWHFDHIAWNADGDDYRQAIRELEANMQIVQNCFNRASADLRILPRSQTECQDIKEEPASTNSHQHMQSADAKPGKSGNRTKRKKRNKKGKAKSDVLECKTVAKSLREQKPTGEYNKQNLACNNSCQDIPKPHDKPRKSGKKNKRKNNEKKRNAHAQTVNFDLDSFIEDLRNKEERAPQRTVIAWSKDNMRSFGALKRWLANLQSLTDAKLCQQIIHSHRSRFNKRSKPNRQDLAYILDLNQSLIDSLNQISTVSKQRLLLECCTKTIWHETMLDISTVLNQRMSFLVELPQFFDHADSKFQDSLVQLIGRQKEQLKCLRNANAIILNTIAGAKEINTINFLNINLIKCHTVLTELECFFLSGELSVRDSLDVLYEQSCKISDMLLQIKQNHSNEIMYECMPSFANLYVIVHSLYSHLGERYYSQNLVRLTKMIIAALRKTIFQEVPASIARHITPQVHIQIKVCIMQNKQDELKQLQYKYGNGRDQGSIAFRLLVNCYNAQRTYDLHHTPPKIYKKQKTESRLTLR